MCRSACLGELQNARCAKRVATPTTRASRDLTKVCRTCIIDHTFLSVYSTVCTTFSLWKYCFFFFVQWWTHNDVITLMVPCLPLPNPILLFSVPTIILPLPPPTPVSRSCPFYDGGVFRWVFEGYFCVGSPLKLKSIGPPILQRPAICVCAKGDYVSALSTLFPV
jgi:hypothetical protein